MLPCETVKNRLPEYLAGELPDNECQAVLAHLNACPSCRHHARELQLADMVLGSTAPPKPSENLAASIISAAATHYNNKPRPLTQRALFSPAFLATTASLMCGALLCLIAILNVAAIKPPSSVEAPAAIVRIAGPGNSHIVVQPYAAADLKPKSVVRALPSPPVLQATTQPTQEISSAVAGVHFSERRQRTERRRIAPESASRVLVGGRPAVAAPAGQKASGTSASASDPRRASLERIGSFNPAEQRVTAPARPIMEYAGNERQAAGDNIQERDLIVHVRDENERYGTTAFDFEEGRP